MCGDLKACESKQAALETYESALDRRDSEIERLSAEVSAWRDLGADYIEAYDTPNAAVAYGSYRDRIEKLLNPAVTDSGTQKEIEWCDCWPDGCRGGEIMTCRQNSPLRKSAPPEDCQKYGCTLPDEKGQTDG
jgi:hypothetical protein